MIVLLILAAAIRLVRLAEPEDLVFDETYYAKDACIYLDRDPEVCDLAAGTEQSYVHPPLGKWLIAAGIKVFGYNPFGWRISAAAIGVALVLVVYLLAGRLFRNRWIALVSALLVATDFLLFVQSRVAMLDIFLAFFIALGFLFLAMDRDSALALRERLGSPDGDYLPVRRPENRLAAGVAFGMALAVKWSAIYALAAAAVLGLAWTAGLVRRSRRGQDDDRRAGRRALARDALFTAMAFGIMPLLVYLGSYSDWFARTLSQECPYSVPAASGDRLVGAGFYGLVEGECVGGVPGTLLNLADLHYRVAQYHLNLEADHPYQSKAWTWPFVLRPVAYFYEGPSGRSVEILGGANLATWGASILAAVWLLRRSLRRWAPERLVLVAWAAQYLPWLLVSRPLFFFYMTPVVPFMMIGLAAGLNTLRARGVVWRRLVIAFLLLGVGVMFAIFYPVLTAVEIDYDLWRRLMWISNFDCGDLECGWI